MSGRRKIGSVWRITSLAVGKPVGNLQHVKAVIDRGGQIEILYTGVGRALARDAQGIVLRTSERWLIELVAGRRARGN